MMNQMTPIKKTLYFDYNATRPIRSSIKTLLAEMYDITGNASSPHQQGLLMKRHVDHARQKTADILSIPSDRIIWTSGATESNNTVVKGYTGPVIVSAIEHPSIYDARDNKIVCPVTVDGVVRLDVLEGLLKQHPHALVCITAAGSETGVIQPLSKIIPLVHAYNGFIFSDCVQACGKIFVPYDKLDGFSLSGHKIGTPFGIGLLALKPELKIEPLMVGGGQERFKRAGTTNVYGAVAFAQALEEALSEVWDDTAILRDYLDDELKKIHNTVMIVSKECKRLPNTTGFIVPNLSNMTQMMHYDIERCYVSLGTACASGTLKTADVLERMHLTKDFVHCFIRISFGLDTTREDVQLFLDSTKRLEINRS